MVLEDVRQRYVSVERAENDYGVALEDRGDELVLAAEKTRLLRGN
jgi:N-methylhydantoinase B/oxoprolinase/acetone carboxylase alpha subunit